ncbi:hypothetical protein F2Q70_00022409 [Brassica cretica]|uniref:Uncharacterized protein n=1 Tax=Brassica cretica TaxID=69181 RepID=A0A8S9HFE2_BRACR|nr:hypothetical protein F2Q70_00022409 [Brassica cretica]KAF2555824.1 hypothetical protein F2Q68_00016509 [Brassica cretica]
MAIDGSFNLKLALETFSERCPKIAAFPLFKSILSNGEEVEEVINALSDVFLHPELTIPLVHYFLPIIKRVVDKVVGLLHLVGDLSSSSDYSDDVSVLENALNEGVSFIDFYVRRGQRLELHESACLAFSRALHLNTSLPGLLQLHTCCVFKYYIVFWLLDLRFSLSCGTDWSCYLDSMKRLSDCPSRKRHLVEKHREAVWCGIQILSVVLRCTDRMAGCFGFGGEEPFSCLLRWEEFFQDIEIEKAGSDGRKGAADEDPKGGHLVGMSNLSLNHLKFTLGKPALIRNLADESGNHVVFIHMDDQLDEKTLVGTYVCTDQPGEFKWLPGSLTQAIMNGFWVVLEDIDKAPSDVPLVLSPLLGGSCSFVTSHGEVIKIAESFQLFSTISTPECSVSHIGEAGNSLSPLWRRIVVYPPDRESLQNIVGARYQNLILIETYEKVNSALRPQFSGSATENSATFSSPSSFSLRDLLKLCERVQGLPSYDGHAISQEAADIFSASYMSTQNRATVSEIVASVWNVLVPESQHKPPIQELSKTLKIGRVSLPLGETASHDRTHIHTVT